MIKQINLNTIPFNENPQVLVPLKQINYFFGANGSGKTTISKIIAHPEEYPNCNIAWTKGAVLECSVYNRDFVEANFSQQSSVKGIFTLGDKAAETARQIDDLKEAISTLKTEIVNLSVTLQGEDGNGGKKKELSQLEEIYVTRFWESKVKHANQLVGGKKGGGLSGFINSKEKFKEKVLLEATNISDLLPITELETKAATVFSDNLAQAGMITQIQPQKLLALEKEPILAKKIIGKEDVDIAAMIKKLGNSDWVRQGLLFYSANERICPFCQRMTDENFAKSLEEYFDESFEQDSIQINMAIVGYSTESQRIQEQIQSIINLNSSFLNNAKLENEKKLLDSLIINNLQRLEQKKKEASQAITLDSLQGTLDEIIILIVEANKKIAEHNAIVKNLINENKILTGQIWRFIVEELKNEISSYMKEKQKIMSAIENIDLKMRNKANERNAKEIELKALEKQTTTVLVIKDEINKMLSGFGFKNFKLDVAHDGKTYKLIRENGEEANKTLSEGERNFLTFLYFYYMLKGSQEETGHSNDKIVVFDDPISSLDNDVLFIVSTLIRNLIQDASDRNVKQVFILTHNIYFHKEVTYKHNRKECSLKTESFWLVKKKGIGSVVELQETNPIKTSYELLWNEVKSENRNNATIQNTLRRILENYFKLLGNIPLDKLYEGFSGDDKLKCKALCSWVNDGSHSVFGEDFYTPLDEGMIEKYLFIFKQIFDKLGHTAHYNMMMGISKEAEYSEETN